MICITERPHQPHQPGIVLLSLADQLRKVDSVTFLRGPGFAHTLTISTATALPPSCVQRRSVQQHPLHSNNRGRVVDPAGSQQRGNIANRHCEGTNILAFTLMAKDTAGIGQIRPRYKNRSRSLLPPGLGM
jgi:hypothetical protein